MVEIEIDKENCEEIRTEYTRSYVWKHDPGSGFGFPCDKEGNVELDKMSPNAKQNYEACVNGDFIMIDEGVKARKSVIRLCRCGSLRYTYDLHDARGIFVNRVCSDCENEVRSRYRPEIFEDMNYEANEPIEPEDY